MNKKLKKYAKPQNKRGKVPANKSKKKNEEEEKSHKWQKRLTDKLKQNKVTKISSETEVTPKTSRIKPQQSDKCFPSTSTLVNFDQAATLENIYGSKNNSVNGYDSVSDYPPSTNASGAKKSSKTEVIPETTNIDPDHFDKCQPSTSTLVNFDQALETLENICGSKNNSVNEYDSVSDYSPSTNASGAKKSSKTEVIPETTNMDPNHFDKCQPSTSTLVHSDRAAILENIYGNNSINEYDSVSDYPSSTNASEAKKKSKTEVIPEMTKIDPDHFDKCQPSTSTLINSDRAATLDSVSDYPSSTYDSEDIDFDHASEGLSSLEYRNQRESEVVNAILEQQQLLQGAFGKTAIPRVNEKNDQIKRTISLFSESNGRYTSCPIRSQSFSGSGAQINNVISSKEPGKKQSSIMLSKKTVQCLPNSKSNGSSHESSSNIKNQPISSSQEATSVIRPHDKQQSNVIDSKFNPVSSILRTENFKRESGNNKIEKEVTKRTPEQLQQLFFPNCPTQDLNESEAISENIQKSEQPEVKTNNPNFTQSENSVHQGNFLNVSPEDVSDGEFVDALDIPIIQPTSRPENQKISKIEKQVRSVKAKWRNFQKKDPPSDHNILVCSDKKQYIKRKVKNGVIYYSAKFLGHHGYFVAEGEVSYEILGKRNLMIADSDNFIARIVVTPGEPLDFTKSFRINKGTLIDRVTIVKVLEDELLVQRNEAYNLLKKVLEARSEHISDFQEFAEDFLQISMMLKTYHFFSDRPLLLLQEFLKNQYMSHDLKCVIEQLVNFERSLQKRNKLFPKCTCSSYFSINDLFATMQEIRKNGLRIHQQNLIKKCTTQNSYFLCRVSEINRLPVEKLLRITNKDIKLFTDLLTLTNEENQTSVSVITLEFIDNLWSHFYQKLLAEKCMSLKDSGPLSHPIYFFLVKSLRDVINDIIGKSTTTAQELFKKERGDFKITSNISWISNSPVNQSQEKQYNLIYKLMKHFEPGSYTNKVKFNYRFVLLEGIDDTLFWRTIRGLVAQNRNDLFKMPEERLIWLYIVDAGIAPILQGETDERFKNLSLALLAGFLNFVKNSKHIRYESFRIAAYNIIKFAAQLLPYFKVTNSVTQGLDNSILDKQVDFINEILSYDEEDNISYLFSSLMEVYNEYWELRESIIGNLKLPCTIFRGLMDEIMLKILEIVENALCKKVELQLIIQYFRLFNEFLKHFKGINFTWFISENIYLPEMKESVREIKKGDKITYEILYPEKFLDVLNEKDKEPPKHFLIETVLELLKIIRLSLNKSNWTEENRLKAAGDLFLAIGHSFAHFEDQTDYIDIELFMKDCTIPFKSVIEKSLTYSDFKTRLDNVENYYLYARKQNQIGIKQALDLCAEEVKKARENGFDTSFNRKILEECFDRYAQKLALLQKLEIPAILENLREQMKNVDALPFARWTPHFKQNVLPVLLADLAAIWTILESKDVANIEKRIEPHCIQIICVLRLIGADYLGAGVQKHFAQVLTGQGKSVILALLASLIALTGHKANIVCYSKYLASRDQNNFDTYYKTFEELLRGKKISYYTFDNMAEDALTRKINGQKVNLRDVVNELILNKLENKTIETIENPADSVLLIDEVDVFFSENFYGQTYNPCSTIGMTALREIQPKLWEIVEGGAYEKNIVLERIREFINELIKDEKYDDFKNFLSCTSNLFEESLGKMVDTAITVSKEKNNPDVWFTKKYKIDYNGTISYRERLGFYSTNTYIGYYNAFNYFRLKKSNYDDKNFSNFGYFFIIWGYISYANLPLMYKNILGVSGTLMTLNQHEINAIRKYGINTMSAMPSFFGKRKLIFNPNEHLSIQDTISNWHSKIYDHISKIIKANRAVLVFFDTDSEIKEFENKYRNNINRLYILIGNEEPEEMAWRINEVGVALTVTLATSAMGRGIDYKSNDRSVEEKGGVHVIQTFFSLDEKADTQMKGRTARKDNKGSYELILCREHLKEIGCDEKSDGTPINTYQELSETRLSKANSMGAIVEAKVRDSEKENNLTMDFLKSLSRSFTPEERKKCFSKYPFTKPE